MYVSEMSQQRTDGLEILRQRATCPICKEFYTTPKRLSCSHVFCLNCIKRHLQVHRDVNFPPCPMCRCPINKAYSEVTSLEPARAEEEIAEFVKQLEICGLCQQKENPSVKCTDCEFLLCDDCRMGHYMMEPTHVTVSIVSCDEIIQYSNLECKQHGKPMNKFCVMCERALCVLCEWFEHDACKRRWDEQDVQDKYRQGFLSQFIHNINTSALSKKQTALPRIVNLNEIVLMGRKWQTDDSKNLIQKRVNKSGTLKMGSRDYQTNGPLTTLSGNATCAKDVLRLQVIFRLEELLDFREVIISFLKDYIRLTLAILGLLLFNIVFWNMRDVRPYSLIVFVYSKFSTVYFWLICRQLILCITKQIVTFINLFKPLPSRTRKILALYLQIQTSLLYGLGLHLLAFFTNEQSVFSKMITTVVVQFYIYCISMIMRYIMKMLTVVGVKIMFLCQKKLRIQILEYRPVQCVRSYFCFQTYVIVLLAIPLSRIVVDIPDWLWWQLIALLLLFLVHNILIKFLMNFELEILN